MISRHQSITIVEALNLVGKKSEFIIIIISNT